MAVVAAGSMMVTAGAGLRPAVGGLGWAMGLAALCPMAPFLQRLAPHSGAADCTGRVLSFNGYGVWAATM